MRLLLDTHIWVWSVLEPEHLAPCVAHALEEQSNELWLSPISAWELVVLVERGRLVLDRPPVRWINEVCATIPLRDAPLTRHVAIESRRLALPHQDPADRFIAATAKVYDLTLVTSDERLVQLEGIKTFGAR